MSDQKKAIKCGACGQMGHNKRTCTSTKKDDPKLEIKTDDKPEVQFVYLLEMTEDNDDSITTTTSVYASFDGLVNGVEELIKSVHKDYDMEDQEIKIPNKDQIDNVLTKMSLQNLLIKIEDENSPYTCHIRVYKKKVNA